MLTKAEQYFKQIIMTNNVFLEGSMMNEIKNLFLVLLLSLMYLFGCTEKNNILYNYLKNAELQAEDSQLENIKQALNDALILTPDELKSKRYADYTDRPDQWDLQILFEKHFVPDDPQKRTGKNFYEDIRSKDVQKYIQHILEEMATGEQ